jgi:A/G-specific adenine glycosylase
MTPRLESLLGKRAVAHASIRRDLGELTHVFSHVKHHMGVEHVHLASRPDRDLHTDDADADQPVRWMTTDEMGARGITTGVKKVLQLVLKPDVTPKAAGRKKSPVASKRGAAHIADGAKRAKTIVSFFTKL